MYFILSLGHFLAFSRKEKTTPFSKTVLDSLSNILNCVCQTTLCPTKSFLSCLIKRNFEMGYLNVQVQTKEGNFQEENLDVFVFLHIQFPSIQSLLFLSTSSTVAQCRMPITPHRAYFLTPYHFPILTPSCPA